MEKSIPVYVKLPRIFYGPGNVKNRPEVVVCLHYNWLLGDTSVARLANFLDFAVNEVGSKSYHCFKRCPNAILDHIESIYKGKDNQLDLENYATSDLMLVENSDGVALIDLTGEKPKYCFMSVFGLGEALVEASYKDCRPYNAEEWLELHYAGSELKELRERSKNHLKDIGNYNSMSLDDCIAMFPRLAKEFYKAVG